ncbi:MAG: condensation protein, partial [Acidobacteria bacterium]
MSRPTESAGEMTLEQKRELLASMLKKQRESRTFPLSFAQHRLWLLNQLEPDSPLYNVSHALRLKGSLDVAALERSFQEIWRRHEVLRATFDVVDGDPVQRFGSDTPFVIQKEELSHLAEDEREDALSQLIREEAQRPYDLTRGPLLRVKLWRLGSDDHLLLVSMHHIV